jgi:hypothetical protein
MNMNNRIDNFDFVPDPQPLDLKREKPEKNTSRAEYRKKEFFSTTWGRYTITVDGQKHYFDDFESVTGAINAIVAGVFN